MSISWRSKSSYGNYLLLDMVLNKISAKNRHIDKNKFLTKFFVLDRL